MGIVDDLVDAWEEHQERGEPIAIEELCRDHPELLDAVKKQIDALEAVDKVFGTSGLEPENASRDDAKLIPPEYINLPGRFQIQQLHASGGIGNVYRAHDWILNRPVAIKFPKRSNMSRDQLARFQREALITGQLDHPGIVPILALDASKASEPCYVMRFIDGKTLQESAQEALQRANGNLPTYLRSQDFRHLLQSFVALCNIVAYAHGQGVIHRDIKPSNVMLGPFGETLLLDWGIAKDIRRTDISLGPSPLDANERATNAKDRNWPETVEDPFSDAFTKTGQSFGTPAYASPEQLMGTANASRESTDIFSLGATLFFILNGRSAMEVAGWNAYLSLCKEDHADLSRLLPKSIPASLKAICRHSMQIRPEIDTTPSSNWALMSIAFWREKPLASIESRWPYALAE